MVMPLKDGGGVYIQDRDKAVLQSTMSADKARSWIFISVWLVLRMESVPGKQKGKNQGDGEMHIYICSELGSLENRKKSSWRWVLIYSVYKWSYEERVNTTFLVSRKK